MEEKKQSQENIVKNENISLQSKNTEKDKKISILFGNIVPQHLNSSLKNLSHSSIDQEQAEISSTLLDSGNM